MMTGTPAAVLFVLFVIAMVGFIVWLMRKRKAELGAVRSDVAARGWTFAERDDALASGFESLPFGRGHGQHARDVIRSETPDFCAFTYSWRTGSGDNKNTHTRRITMLRTGPSLPRTEIEPQTVVARAETAAAGGDLNIELADFNNAWSVRAADARVSHALLHPRMVERLMQPDLYGRGVFFEGGLVAIVDHVVQTPQLGVHAADTVLVLQKLADLIPSHLVREFT